MLANPDKNLNKISLKKRNFQYTAALFQLTSRTAYKIHINSNHEEKKNVK
jgi:hypothetical protein